MQIAFIGLGQMGLPMARNLIRGGHQLRVFDLQAAPAATLVAEGATVAATPADAARGAAILITMLPNGEAVRAALFGDHGAVGAMAAGAVVIDMSTIHPLESDALAREVAARGVSFVDAPVGRTSDHAVQGTLLIMAGADAAMVERLAPVFSLLGSEVVTTGATGRGIRIKIVNNFMSVALNALSAEAAALCQALDLPLESALEVMRGTPANKGHFTTTWPGKVLKGDLTPAFMIDLAHKDIGIALDVANRCALPMPMGAAAREVYSAARAAGRGRQDWSAILEQVLDSAHLPHPGAAKAS